MGIDNPQTFLYLSKQAWYYKIVFSIYQCRHNAKIFWCRDFQMIGFCLIMIDAKSLWTSWLFCINILFFIFEGNKVEFKLKKYSEDYCGGNKLLFDWISAGRNLWLRISHKRRKEQTGREANECCLVSITQSLYHEHIAVMTFETGLNEIGPIKL